MITLFRVEFIPYNRDLSFAQKSSSVKGIAQKSSSLVEISLNSEAYGSNSFKSNLEEIMRDTIINYVDSKFSDLDWKLSSIESKLNCM